MISTSQTGLKQEAMDMAKRAAIDRQWQLQDAKARFSEVFRLARSRGPQRITKHGKEAVVVIPTEEYEQLLRGARKKEKLILEFFKFQ